MAKRALLVGCNYPGTQCELHGCVNDVKRMHATLTSRYGFDESEILVLIDTDRSGMQPTGANIRSCLAKLIRGTGSGDVLVFHYSGHGTQVPPEAGAAVDDTGAEEAIVPTDMNLLTDDDFRELVNEIPGDAYFTFISDSCHSGGLIDSEKEQIGDSVWGGGAGLMGLVSHAFQGSSAGRDFKPSEGYEGRRGYGGNSRYERQEEELAENDEGYGRRIRGGYDEEGESYGRRRSGDEENEGYGAGQEPLYEGGYGARREPEYEGGYGARREPEYEGGYGARREPEYEGGYGARREPEYEGGYGARREPEYEGRYGARREPEYEGGYGARREPEYEGGYGARREPEYEGGYGARREPEYEGGYGARREPEYEGGYGGRRESEYEGGYGGRRQEEEYESGYGAPRRGGKEDVSAEQVEGDGYGGGYRRSAPPVEKKEISVDLLTQILSERTGHRVDIGNIRTTLFDMFGDSASPSVKTFANLVFQQLQGGGQDGIMGAVSSLATEFLQSKLDGQDEEQSASYLAPAQSAGEYRPQKHRGSAGRGSDCGILLSGCQSDETSADANPSGSTADSYGAFSNAIQLVLSQTDAPISNRDLILQVRAVLQKQGFKQHPCLYSNDRNANAVFICE